MHIKTERLPPPIHLLGEAIEYYRVYSRWSCRLAAVLRVYRPGSHRQTRNIHGHKDGREWEILLVMRGLEANDMIKCILNYGLSAFAQSVCFRFENYLSYISAKNMIIIAYPCECWCNDVFVLCHYMFSIYMY